MNKPSNAQYFCRGKVNWRAGFIIISFITVLWALVLFIPRPGSNEKNKYFYLLLGAGVGLNLLILYVCTLRQWSKTWISDGVIHSDIAFGLFPLSKKMSLSEVKEVCFIYNGVISRKKTDSPNSGKIREMKALMAEKIEAGFAAGKIQSPLLSDDDKYRFPVHCGRLVLKDNSNAEMKVSLDVVLNRADFKEVKKFISFLPEGVIYTWRFGKVNVQSRGFSY